MEIALLQRFARFENEQVNVQPGNVSDEFCRSSLSGAGSIFFDLIV